MPSGVDTVASVRTAIADLVDERAERVEQGQALLTRAAALGNPTAHYEALVLCASVAWVLESDEKGIEYTEQAIALEQAALPHGGITPAAWARWRMPYNQANIADVASRYEEGERFARSAVAVAVESLNVDQEADATALLSWLHLQQGQAVSCVEAAIRAIRLAEPGSYALGYGYFNLALVLDAHGACGEAMAMMQRVIDVGHTNRVTAAIDLLELSRIASNACRPEIVADSLEKAGALVESVGSPNDLVARLRTARGRAWYLAGDLDAAERTLRPIDQVLASHDVSRRAMEEKFLLLQVAAARGDHERVRQLGASLEIPRLRPWEQISVLELLADAHEAVGKTDRVLLFLEQLVALQQRTNRLGPGLVRAVELVDDNDRLLDRNDELAERNADLEALQSENALVMSFVANDLRGSLSSLLLAAAASGGHDERLPSIVNRFNRIISQLGESVDIETDRGAIAGGPSNLSDLVFETITELAPVAERKRIAIETDLEPDLIVSVITAAEITSIASNLVSNALKYCSAGDAVSIKLTSDQTTAHLSVIDTGPGIDAADVPRIFEKFERLERDPTDGESTSGLGLYIVRRLADIAGGTCGVDSDGLGTGCCFWVELPTDAR